MSKLSKYTYHSRATQCRGVEIEVSVLEEDGRFKPESFVWDDGVQVIPHAPFTNSMDEALKHASLYATPFVEGGE